MAPSINCCLCGRTLKGVRPFFLHLATCHEEEGFRLGQQKGRPTFVCACGYGYALPPAGWRCKKEHTGYTAAEHLYVRGGLKAHLYALLLGENDYIQYTRHLKGGRQLP